MTSSKEIAAQDAPSTNAIVRRYGESIARSPKDIKRGEGVFLDRHGQPLARRGFRRIVSVWRVGIYGALIGGAALAFTGAWAAGAVLYLTGLMPILVFRYRGARELLAIDVLVRRGQLDEGQRRFDRVPQLRRRNPVAYCATAGSLASHRGDYATALTWWREALVSAKGLQRQLLKLSIVKALLLVGNTEEARREFEAVKFPTESDEVLTGQSLTQIMFVLCDSSSRPVSDDELHDRARRALEYSHTGVELAAIGWAFDRRGDNETAHWLAGEAVERMHYPYLATWWPALQQWLDGHASPLETVE
jgi:hypothetical protein